MDLELRAPEDEALQGELRLVAWLAQDGEEVARGSELLRIEGEEGGHNLEAPRPGVLRIEVQQGSEVVAGQLLGILEVQDRPKSAAPPQQARGAVGRKAIKKEVLLAIEGLAHERGQPVAQLGAAAPLDAGVQLGQAAVQVMVEQADMSRVLALRQRYKASFKARHQVDLGLLAFFVLAVVDALEHVPALNVQLEDGQAARNRYYDIGVTVPGPEADLIPVIRDAERKRFAEVQHDIARYARQARDGSFAASSSSGGVFTVADRQQMGALLSTAPLVPPQCGALAIHAIRRRPVVLADEKGERLAVRPMMHLSLAYHGQVVEARDAALFLARVVASVEAPERLMLQA